ncbi:MAG: hypothetical protein KDF60_13805 [Calditrichaeota bacterium]|nr:hypothetical protein [Calditrichota bacterium]
MMKFFSQIRRKLASENKIIAYLRYAVGEIILVVIGILIALQINNWNAERKERNLESKYYCRLLEDIVQDKEQIAGLTGLANERLKASNQAVRLLLKDKPKKLEVGVQLHLAIKAIYSDFQPNNSAFEDLKSGANLNIISDKSIIKALNHYFNKVEELKSIIMVNGKYAVDILFAHDDNFANGLNQSSMLSGRFLTGMEKDVYDAITIDKDELLSGKMKTRLLNESLEYISVNTRQLGLYNDIMKEVDVLRALLKAKCSTIMEKKS